MRHDETHALEYPVRCAYRPSWSAWLRNARGPAGDAALVATAARMASERVPPPTGQMHRIDEGGLSSAARSRAASPGSGREARHPPRLRLRLPESSESSPPRPRGPIRSVCPSEDGAGSHDHLRGMSHLSRTASVATRFAFRPARRFGFRNAIACGNVVFLSPSIGRKDPGQARANGG